MTSFQSLCSFGAAMTLVACGLIKDRPRPPPFYPEGSAEDGGGWAGDASASDDDDVLPRSLTLMQGSEDGARAFLQHFLDPQADFDQLTGSMRPMTSDYEAIFDAETAVKVESGSAKEWNARKTAIKPKKGQTEIKLWSATGTELAQGTGSAKDFPPEYRQIGAHLAPERLFFRFKFVEPGKDTTVAYDALTYVQDHWVLVPKPWKALGIKDEAAAPKPKGRRKKK